MRFDTALCLFSLVAIGLLIAVGVTSKNEREFNLFANCLLVGQCEDREALGFNVRSYPPKLGHELVRCDYRRCP